MAWRMPQVRRGPTALQRTPGSHCANHPAAAGGQGRGRGSAAGVSDVGRILPHDVVFKSAKVSGSGGIVGNWDRYRGKRREGPVHGSLAEGFETIAVFGTIGQYGVNQAGVGDRRPRSGASNVAGAGAKGQKCSRIAVLREAGLEGDFRGVNAA